ncbi:PAS domain S-box-containing protein [Nocardioides scoriae]|uniref:Sensor-like histidine kinase SenX3 n=1 Tax=Nocardioides scoriae TaxID=642780 RepID=A0A1H1WQ72_9ACTN|nr:ATP-binding protein [Nocardioides scoriae]SDS99162.1 PAS domain S-box-containing protein [Nocardioides scoriae]
MRAGGPSAQQLLLLAPDRAGRRTALVVATGFVLVGALALLAPDTLAVAVVAQLVGVALCVPAAVLCARAGRVTRARWSAGWWMLAGAAGLWGAGNLVTVVSVGLPGRGINAFIYPLQGAAMLLVLATLLVLPRPRFSRGEAARAWLDVVVLVAGLGLLGSVSLVGQAVEGSTGLVRVFALAYPAATLAMVGLAYELSRRHVYPPRPELALLSASFAAWLVGAAAYTLTPDALVAPAWISWAVGVGTTLLALSAHRVVGRRPESVQLGSRVSRVVLAAPEVVVVVAAVTAVLTGLEHWPQRVLAAVTALAVVVRHLVVSADARRFHWRLQHEVADRTADLRDWTERYATILDTVGDGIVSTDAQGRITFANASARSLLGRTSSELVGREACDALCTVHGAACPFDEALRGVEVVGVDAELRRGDGAVVPVELHASPHAFDVASGSDEPGVVIAFRDVSARLAVEQVKRQFVSSVSHELRTPLTSVRGVLEMFVDGDAGALSPEGHTLVANASRGVERLSRLVDDIIDAEKLATGEFRMQRSRISLGEVLRQTVTALEPLATGAQARIELGPVADVEVWGDADRIEQALVNLVGNAVKFSPPDGVVGVEVETTPDVVLVSVRDQGPGLPADQLEHVFERFHQATGGDATDRGGTGLGLTITRAIVQQHGGRVWVESTEGEGARFTFSLPVAAGARGPGR